MDAEEIAKYEELFIMAAFIGLDPLRKEWVITLPSGYELKSGDH